MKPWLRLLVPVLLLTLGVSTVAKVPPEKSEATFKVSDGLSLKLWACEPSCMNPTCMDIDHKGRVWICESLNYRNKLRGMKKFVRPKGDRIVILEDSKGTGKADKATVFYQSPDLLAPLGIAVAKDATGPGYKVFVCQSPNILLFEDKDGDGKADGPPKKLLTGFNGFDHDHGVHGILIGPDAKLYFSVGDTGVNGLQSSDGKGVKWKSNSTDCRAGTIWRCDLDGKNLQLIAHNFRNEYEPCVDSFGTVFVSDNDDDGNQQTRICYVMPGGNYGYHPRDNSGLLSHWHEEFPGVVPKILRTFFGSPTGICVYEGSLLPKKYQGQLLHTDAGPRHLRCYHLKPQGASYNVDREDMVQSTDEWFRPSDVCVAPDGSIFVADWYDPGVGGHNIQDWSIGRIYRVAPKGNKPAVPKVDLSTTAGTLKALASPALSVRHMAMMKLRGMKLTEASKVLKAPIEDTKNPILRARALWAFAGRRDMPKADLIRLAENLLKDEDARFGVLGLRLLKDRGIAPSDLDQKKWKHFADLDVSIRREALLLLRDVAPSKCKETLYALMKGYDGKDRFYLCACGIAVGQHDKERRKELLGDFEKQFPSWSDTVAGLVFELQPPNLLPLLKKRVADVKLTTEQRGQVIELIAAQEGSDAGKFIITLIEKADTRDKAVALTVKHLSGKWSSLASSEELSKAIKALLAKADTRLSALSLIAASKQGKFAANAAVLIAKSEPLAVRKAAIVALGNLPGPVPPVTLIGALDGDLKAEAIAALGRNESKEALEALQKVIKDHKRDVKTRQSAITALTGNRSGALWLLSDAGRKEIPTSLVAETGRLLRSSVYGDIKKRAAEVFPAPGKINPKKLPAITELIKRKGSIAQGRKLFANSAKTNLQCLKCHTVQGAGGAIGPDLSMIGKKASRENMFESILYPSKAIADQFLTWNIVTRKGQALSGLIVAESGGIVTLRDAEGRDTKIPAKDIETRTKNMKSIMPEDLVAHLSEQDVVDLVEYLLTLKTASVTFDRWNIAGPFDNISGMQGLDKVYGPEEKAIDLKAMYPGKHGKVAWRTVKPGAGNYVDLAAYHGKKANQSVSYLMQAVTSTADQDATILIGTDDGAKLWINGKQVWTSRETRAAAPNQNTVKIQLKKGENRILLKINNGNSPHGFYFTLLAEQELKQAGKK